ncbi:unnamed protein product [Brachionus calyciflorus]|uniref:Coiled-coil domain-containing protein 130 n=1 Tax=Brachionus calyciflorus TaxID=104777 RepID=A0A813X7N3_9BILA|nr:unnamed protein product [Brachionus calyciflorus]
MGERKGQNKYYPPDFDPKKHGNLNRYHGTHALRERASKLDQGILIIRFEMPYNIWCDGCKAHIAMGVRYNAEKKKVGMYYSTPIFEFRMKCHLCDQYFDIRTDPQNSDYVIISGARRKEQRWDMAENEQIVTEDKNDIKRLSLDPMFSLEHETLDKEKSTKLMPTLKELEAAKSDWKDDYAINSLLRKELREEKKIIKEQKSSDQKFLDKWNININLVRENEEDVKLASLFKFNTVEKIEESKAEKRKTIESESIFETNSKKISNSTKDLVLYSNNSKNSCVEKLKKQINKSTKGEIILNDGFNFNSNHKPLSSINLGIVIKKPNENPNSNNKKEETCSKSIQVSALVANDYGSSSDDDNKQEKN